MAAGALVGTGMGALARMHRQINTLQAANQMINPLVPRHRIIIADGSKLCNTRDIIYMEILKHCKTVNGEYRTNCTSGPVLTPADGNYYMDDFCFILRGDYIAVESSRELSEINEYVRGLYSKYFSAEVSIPIYTHTGDTWRFSGSREPRAAVGLRETQQKVLDFVEKTMQQNIRLLLHGPPRSGKTTVVELLASKMKYSIYSICLNTRDMDDGVLIQLMTSVPQRSIIVFEELDIDLEEIQRPGSFTTVKGFLTATDGAARLPAQTILIITTSNRDKLFSYFTAGSLGHGRVDCEFAF
ncbi:AAA family ATPase [Candidatus Saccharibacteria bacterium]|nr:AAA family ATPase [Candidatus Saccharibacteria bacterium]